MSARVLVLGLESSCDETAAAVVEDGCVVRSNVVASQVDLHARYGGVVPELAARAHVVSIAAVIEEALSVAGIKVSDLGGIAVTQGPGLVGALLVALQAGKALAYGAKKPLVGVHHLAGHLSAVYLQPDPPPMPHLALVVSGGHSSLIRVNGHSDLQLLGATRDDAAGEAFDKVAKLLGLGYPGGVAIDRLAQTGDPEAVPLPRSMVKKQTGLEFSFSGLKTAVLHWVRENGQPEGQALADLCASFQATVVEVLVRKTRAALAQEGMQALQACGGVAANSGLRATLAEAAQEDGFKLWVPPIKYCTDNAAMIASAGFFCLQRGDRSGFSMEPSSNLPLPARAA